MATIQKQQSKEPVTMAHDTSKNGTPDGVAKVTGNFNRIARDLDRALTIARFTLNQRALIDHARELSWSMRGDKEEAIPFRINVCAFARILKVERCYLGRQVRELIQLKVFRDLGDGSCLINKDYREWVDEKGYPRLSDTQIEWCLTIRKRVTNCVVDYSGVSSPLHTPLSSPLLTPLSSPLLTPSKSVSSPLHTPLSSPLLTPLQPEPTPLVPRIGTRGEFNSDSERELNPEKGGRGEPPREDGLNSVRSQEDMAEVNRAITLLAGCLATEHLAARVMQTHNLPGSINIPGWKWRYAAERHTSPDFPEANRGKWAYFLAIATKATEAERDPKPAPKPETRAQRQRREKSEAFKAKAAEMKAKYLAIEAAKTKAKEATDGDR
jgi:hypothetical protein